MKKRQPGASRAARNGHPHGAEHGLTRNLRHRHRSRLGPGHAGVYATRAGHRRHRQPRSSGRRLRSGRDFVRDPHRARRRMWAVRRGIRRKAANGDLADATARLDAFGADRNSIALTRHAFRPKRSTGRRMPRRWPMRCPPTSTACKSGCRPPSASGRWRWREAEERKRRKVQLALAASVGLLLLGGGSFGWWQSEQTAAAN